MLTYSFLAVGVGAVFDARGQTITLSAHPTEKITDNLFHFLYGDRHVVDAWPVCMGIGGHRHASRRLAADDRARDTNL